MLYILSTSRNPFINLATEEFLLKNKDQDIFMLWRSEPCVIVGKHQNALAEINYKYLLENNLTAARRLSGGGAVVHDMQNLNFTFIANGKEGKLIDFKRFVSPVINYLQTIGISAHIGEKNDIRIGELKISGNAEHVWKKRVLHHGTLLFNSDLARLKEAIKVAPDVYFDKAVQSNRATVTNIIDHLPQKLTIEEFTNGLSNFIQNTSSDTVKYVLDKTEIKLVNELAKEKYSREDWIFGYSPKYKFVKTFNFNSEKWTVELQIEKGLIINADVKIHNIELSFVKELYGIVHLFLPIFEVLKRNYPNLNSTELSELTYCFF